MTLLRNFVVLLCVVTVLFKGLPPAQTSGVYCSTGTYCDTTYGCIGPGYDGPPEFLCTCPSGQMPACGGGGTEDCNNLTNTFEICDFEEVCLCLD